MKKCVRIIFAYKNGWDFLEEYAKKYARSLDIEGIAEKEEKNTYAIVVNGKKEAVDTFVDKLQEMFVKKGVDDYMIEPFLKEEDYRGVFRVIK